jgi:hypothetical protein
MSPDNENGEILNFETSQDVFIRGYGIFNAKNVNTGT